jgi:2-methylisocitrate lyase-like PEP mutase family enzyme
MPASPTSTKSGAFPTIPETIAALVKAVGGPVNITGRPGMPNAAALERLGVARITIASAPTLVVMDAIQS